MKKLLSDIFDVRSIKLNLDGKTKEMVFIELVDCIADLNLGCDRAEMLSSIKKREEEINTGVGNGVAILRCVCKGAGKMAGAVGISQQGLDYGSVDNKPVHVIFFLVCWEQDPSDNHLQVCNYLFNLAKSEAVSMLKNAKDAQEIYAFLSHA